VSTAEGSGRPSVRHVETEAVHPGTAALDQLAMDDPVAAIEMMLDADRGVVDAVGAARKEIAAAVEQIAERLDRGGRLFYLGAGTSGRLGVLDAVECPPTFQSAPGQVQGVLAGGGSAMFVSAEGVEDDPGAGAKDLAERAVGERDFVLGISASASAPYVHGGLAYAKQQGARTALLACVPMEQYGDSADISIRVVTGPESLAGSTRLRAGTATKLVLNMISTLVMARAGKVHGNLMVDVNTSGNEKLKARGRHIVTIVVGCERERAEALLKEAGGRVKVAVVMGLRSCDAERAGSYLDAAKGVLRTALMIDRG
jgi:N-acetylmuramic acid 6-phosphate etherase